MRTCTLWRHLDRTLLIAVVAAFLVLPPLSAPMPVWADSADSEVATAVSSLPDLPEGVTSFGAAITGDWLYVYGGHTGRAHRYSIEGQSNAFRRLNLKQPGQWENLPNGPRLQGLALVAHAGVIYRVGGFSAHNHMGDEQDIRSRADFARFNPAEGKWEELPAMPAPRSSHDAVVVGDTLYVVGGWSMGHSDENQWHDSALSVDLSAEKLEWKQLPQPSFRRRALTLGEYAGKVYVIGGMQEEGGTTGAVSVYDPQTQQWTDGPTLKTEGRMAGFGASAFNAGGELFVSTYDGTLQKLSSEGKEWTVINKLEDGRFFHRMLPMNDATLLFVGGASMESGKFLELQTVGVGK